MKSLTIEVPDRLAEEMRRMVREGWYGSEAELARTALGEFVRARHAELQERFQREDIAWAVAEAKSANR